MSYKVIVNKSLHYFTCSTLPLLNGDIKHILDEYPRQQPRYLKPIILRIISMLEKSQELNDRSCPRRIRNEYKRVLKLYKYRLKKEEENESK